MKPPKVAQILFSGLGGHSGVAFALVECGVERSWRWCMGFLGAEPLLPAYARRCRDADIDFLYIAATPGAAWRSWPAVYRWLCKERPDAIILHGPAAVIPCAIYSRSRRIPLLVVEHQQNTLKPPAEWAASKVAMCLANAVVVLSADYRAGLEAELGKLFCGRKVHVIPNGLDLSVFSPRLKRLRGPVRIGMAGRFTAIKRFDILIDAFRKMVLDEPDLEVELSLAGDGDTLAAMKVAAVAAGIGSKVRFLGALDENQLADWYRQLDIYAHASDGETMSLSLLQAMASALPIVASKTSGIREMLSPFLGSAVRLVPHEDIESFTQALLETCRGLAGSSSAADKLRQECLELYSRDIMFSRYERVIQDERQGSRNA